MSGQTCAVCGVGGYWVAYSPPHGEDRCVNHASHEYGWSHNTDPKKEEI